LSLEGQGFWIVGMSPVTMGRVLASKFVAAVTVLLFVSVILMYLSVEMLQVFTGVKTAALAIALTMSFAVAGMSTGLGAVFLDLKQRNPAAIISSFGGTLNLVFSLLFMFMAIIPFAGIYHFRSSGHLHGIWFTNGVAAAYIYLFLITLIAVWLPLTLGRKSLLAREF